MELEYVTEQEQSGKCFDIPTQHVDVRVRGLKLFPFTKGPIVFWSVCLVLEKLPVVLLRSLPVLGDPRFLKTLFLWFCAFDKFLAKSRESSACLEATEGKSSPNKRRLAFGTG